MNFQEIVQEWIESYTDDEPEYQEYLKEQLGSNDYFDEDDAENFFSHAGTSEANDRIAAYREFSGSGQITIKGLEILATVETQEVQCEMCDDPKGTREFQLLLDDDQAGELGIYPNEQYNIHLAEVGLYGKVSEVWLCIACYGTLRDLVG